MQSGCNTGPICQLNCNWSRLLSLLWKRLPTYHMLRTSAFDENIYCFSAPYFDTVLFILFVSVCMLNDFDGFLIVPMLLLVIRYCSRSACDRSLSCVPFCYSGKQ